MFIREISKSSNFKFKIPFPSVCIVKTNICMMFTIDTPTNAFIHKDLMSSL